jgi:salicylate hydroxylase
VINAYLSSRQQVPERKLDKWMSIYQAIRLPRAQKAQETARQAGDVYEMQRDDMKGKSYDECVPLIRDSLKDRMKWIWNEDIDAVYEKEIKAAVDLQNR